MSLRTTKSSIFRCSSCTNGLYRAVASLHLNLSEVPNLQSFLSSQQRAFASTFAGLSKGHHRKALKKAYEIDAKGKQLPWSARRQRKGPAPWERKSIRAQTLNRGHLDVERPDGAQYNLFSELDYTRDPMKVASIVRRGLMDGQEDQAIEITRALGRMGVRNAVCYNHVIDFYMERGEPKKAMDVYQDMKERACKPDSHTYTIVLRGLSRNAHKSTPKYDIVEKAMMVFSHLTAKKSGVQLLNIHTNALLFVCARAGNIDAVWKAAGMFEEQGKAAPDATTYTTILKALGSEGRPTDRRRRKSSEEDSLENETTGISSPKIEDAEGLWQDVILRWREGDLKLDETLINAMAYLYLDSKAKSDQEKIFKLVEETMNIRLDQRPGNRRVNTTDKHAGATSDNFTQSPGRTQSVTESSTSKRIAAAPDYVLPTQRTLSTLLTACLQLHIAPTATKIWDLLTSTSGPFKIQPDTANYIDYLRCLRIRHSSALALQLVEEMQEHHTPRSSTFKQPNSSVWSPSIFSLSLSTCKRDILNPHAHSNASSIVQIMTQVLPPGPKQIPTISNIKSYLDIGIGPAPISSSSSNNSTFPSKTPNQHRPTLETSIQSLHTTLTLTLPYIRSFFRIPSINAESLQSLCRDAISGCDRILNHPDLTKLLSSSSSSTTNETYQPPSSSSSSSSPSSSNKQSPSTRIQELQTFKSELARLEAKARDLNMSVTDNAMTVQNEDNKEIIKPKNHQSETREIPKERYC
ncbi:putative pentatricopeptide repeat protein [Phaeomoniella chlamydospora]|uniref:Putative pentatricopeptide repeat protein n=1 Tax=Phaeomoniella chlamydospora TaxID=158046 RepID=A0A0G2F4H9_PHACM|nr:putative pentatricopeptide repeat protein [Phaeomoniella chlamydospora]